MNNKEFIAELARRTGYSTDETQRMVDIVIETMSDYFQEDNSVQISSFGSFEIKKKMERIMVNPSTGQRMLVPPKLVLTFKPNLSWKERIKSGGTE
jgi:DNA-binding protein HU-beta/integration host factor subunit alpha